MDLGTEQCLMLTTKKDQNWCLLVKELNSTYQMVEPESIQVCEYSSQLAKKHREQKIILNCTVSV